MISTMNVLLYGPLGNNAVVKLPGRQNAAVVLQADTLRSLVDQASEVVALIDARDYNEHLHDEGHALLDRLNEILDRLRYEVTQAGETLDI
jgi:hypothetical protein